MPTREKPSAPAAERSAAQGRTKPKARKAASAKAPRPKAATNGSPPPIGPKLKQYRLRENLTLTDLQNLTGISKSMLSQIERGSVNPTFARVWHLTRSLGISVSDLLGEVRSALEAPHIYEHRKAHATPTITSSDGLCTTRILSPIRKPLPVEWYEIVLKPGGFLRANAHGNQSWEHQTVIAGKVILEIGSREVLLEEGDTLRYSAEQPHGIRNAGDTEARTMLVVVSMKELGPLLG
ncbi:MAG: XRE family transcriptional regulator [Hyphomicrobiales bacterium]